MRYSTPKLTALASAVALVQSGSNQKPGTTCNDGSSGSGSSAGAYEIDE